MYAVNSLCFVSHIHAFPSPPNSLNDSLALRTGPTCLAIRFHEGVVDEKRASNAFYYKCTHIVSNSTYETNEQRDATENRTKRKKEQTPGIKFKAF